MTEKNLEIAKAWIEAMNKHNLQKMESLYADDIVNEEIPEHKTIIGKEIVTKTYEELFKAFPDCKATIANYVAGENYVLLEVIWEGTNKGEFRGTPATNRKAELKIAYVFKIINGKIYEIREYYDALTYLKQMGLL